MLRSAGNRELYVEYYDIVLNPEAKQAYSFLVGWASTLRGYDCFPSSHGHIKDFRFVHDEDWDFAFIPNQKWLLFYFRKPCFRFSKYARQEILQRFPAANETGSGEFTIKIASLDGAILLSAYVES